MMDDLISRKALIDDLCQDREEGKFDFTEKQAEAADKIVRYINDRIEAQPSVPAVPLDKLCECLAERYEPPYALVDIDKLKMPIDFRQRKEIWMNALINWMEEQNADD